MKEPKDKRTKEYKEYKKKSEGLGDTIAKITKATGIDKAVKFIAGEDCGCDKRKETLNKMFPYRKPNCLEESEYDVLNAFFKRKRTMLSANEQRELLKISNRIFNEKKESSSCGSCVNTMVQRLKRLFNEY